MVTMTNNDPQPSRASELTDDELLIELMHRMRDWRDYQDGISGAWAR